MNQPKVSVIIPVYNTEKYLRECLDSVVNQTLKDIEIICVDDGSEDSSLTILEGYQARDKRIKVLTQKNQGSGPARNKGMCSAEGVYLSFMDSDDFYPESNTLEKLCRKAIEKHALICGGSLSEYLPSGKYITHYDQDYLWGYTFKEEGWIEYRDYQFEYGYYRFLYDREMLVQHGIFFPPLRRYQDPPFFVQAMLQAGRFYAIPDITYCYRSNDKTAVIQASKEKTRDLLLGLTMTLELAKKNDLRKLFEITVDRCARIYNEIINNAAEMDDDEVDNVLSTLNITASEVLHVKPNVFFQMQAENERLEKEVNYLQGDLDHVRRSVSYRLGRAITWAPRKVRGGLRCCRDHGAGYTFRRALYHMGLWRDEEKD